MQAVRAKVQDHLACRTISLGGLGPSRSIAQYAKDPAKGAITLLRLCISRADAPDELQILD